MNDRDRTDVFTALAIGAVVGVGAALLLRSGDESETERLLKSFRPVKKNAGKMMRSAGRSIGRGARRGMHKGEDLLEDAGDVLADLRRDAASIVEQARKELQDVARASVKEAKRTARRTKRRFV